MKTTKIITFLFICLSSTNWALGQTADEKAVNELVANMQTLWNKHDINAYNDLYADDATLVNPVGIFCANKAEVVKMHLEANEYYFKYTSLVIETQKLRFLTPDVAVVNVRYMVNIEQDLSFPDGYKLKKGDKQIVAIIHVLAKKNGSWKISATQVTNVPPPTK